MGRVPALGSVFACAVLLAALAAAPAQAFHGSGNVTALAVDPLTPTTLYVSTADRGVFKSTDGGATWAPAGLANASVSALAIDPHVPSTLYVLTSLGLLKSENAGESWSNTSLMNGTGFIYGFPNPAVVTVGTLAISPRSDPARPATLYAGLNYLTSDAFTEYGWGEVWLSTDGGSSWAPITPGGDPWAFPALRAAPAMAVAPPTGANSATAYLATQYEYDVCPVRDQGAWLTCTLFEDAFVGATTLTVDPQTPETIYAGTNGFGVYKSTDSGATWSGGGSGTITVLVVDPRTPATVYAGTDLQGVLKSTDGGATWNAINTGLLSQIAALGLDPRISALALDAQTPTTLYAGTAAGVLKSTDGGASWNPTGFIQHSALISLSMSPGGVIGGNVSTGTVLLSSPAPEGGAIIQLASSDPAVAAIPSSVTVPAGATSATFLASTGTRYAAVTISASFDDFVKHATLIVAPAMTNLVFSGAQFLAGTTGTGTIGLGVPAPPGGAVLSISSSDPAAAAVPASITTSPGATEASFPISAGAVATTTMVTITVTYAGATRSAQIRVEPTTLSSFSINPQSVVAGGSSTGTVVLTAPAPAGGSAVRIDISRRDVVAAPETVIVPPGATSATFQISVTAVQPASFNSNGVGITVYNGGLHAAQILYITFPAVSWLGLGDSTVIGGSVSWGAVFLNAAAPAGGTVVALLSGNPAVATVPASVTVPAGATSANFTLTTSAVTTQTTVTISSSGGRQAQLTVLPTPPATLSSLSISPASVTGGSASTGTAMLSAAAPPGGAAIALSTSNPALATVPAVVVVPAGTTSVSFPISTAACSSGSVTLTAAFGGSTSSAALAVSSGADSVTIQQADYFVNKRELRVAAKTSGAGAVLSVLVTSSGAPVGTLQNLGDGKHSGAFAWPVNPQSITVRSNLCGSVTSVVRRK